MANAYQIARELAALGRPDDALDVVHEAVGQIGSAETLGLGRIASVPGTMYRVALELRAHGYASQAEDLLNEAIERMEHGSDSRGRSAEDNSQLAWALFEVGRGDEALVLFNRLVGQSPGDVRYRGARAVILARTGRAKEARAEMEALSASTDNPALGHAWAANVSAVLGDTERALRELEESLAQGADRVLWEHTNPLVDSLREDSRFQAMAALRG